MGDAYDQAESEYWADPAAAHAELRAYTRDEVARKLVLYAAMKDRLAELDKELRSYGVDSFREGDRAVAAVTTEHHGEVRMVELGSVTRTRGSKHAEVTDEPAFFLWVLEHRPDAVKTVVDTTVRKALLEHCKRQGAAISNEGIPIPGITISERPGGLQVRKVPEVREILPHVLWGSDDLLSLEGTRDDE